MVPLDRSWRVGLGVVDADGEVVGMSVAEGPGAPGLCDSARPGCRAARPGKR